MQKYMKNFYNGLRTGLFVLLLLPSFLHAEDKDPIAFKLVPGGPQGSNVIAGLLLTIPPSWHVYAPSPQSEETMGFDPTITSEG